MHEKYLVHTILYIHTCISLRKQQASSKMTPGKQHLHVLLLLLISACSTIDAASIANQNATAPCLPDQASSLLQLKRSFIDVDENLASWRAGSDCCHWEGVICDMASGRVISLDLGGFGMQSRRLDPSLFNLTSLRNLSLAFINFRKAQLPSYGFERLTNMIHLNLSGTNFLGQIPIGISHLKNLVTLDFSHNRLYLQEPSFQTFMANLSNLMELRLDYVDISNSGSTWSVVLADSVPQLQTLSLAHCVISGPIHPSFSRLRSLTEIDLVGNVGLTGKVPEFFAEFSSLSILDISLNSFEGQFPAKIFKMKSLRTLALSSNPSLSVCLPDFPVGSNLETLSLAESNLSCGIPPTFINLKYLKVLTISTIGISKQLSLIHELPSLNTLLLSGQGLEMPSLYWIGSLTRLTYLELDGYDFSQVAPSWIGNLTSLGNLQIFYCNFLGPIPHQIGNLTNLAILNSMGSNYNEQPLPSWIVNLKKLTVLNLESCNLSGPIPSALGNLTRLEELLLQDNKLSGKIPESLFSLPTLEEIRLDYNELCGPIGDFPAPLSSPLYGISLSMNQLTGPVPKSFFQLKHLEELRLSSNRLSGIVELGPFWRLKSLYTLDLSNNMLSIVDEDGYSVLPYPSKMNYLNLACCNLTKIPGALRYLDSIIDLDLSNNQINGIIPSWVWENWKDQLTTLNLSYNLFTTLEKSPSLVLMPQLQLLDLSFNRLQGNIPIPISNVEAILDYSNNNFSFIEPDFGKHVTNSIYLDFSKNKLNGHLPSSICSAKQLDMLDLSYNNFSGSVPSCLIESGELSTLKLRENQLHGMLPENIQERCMFQTIDLNGNQFEGKLPRSLSNCQDLELLDVGNNWIVDSFPSWLGVLPQLRVLILSSNQFNGTISNTKGDGPSINHFTSLQILDLASNNFSGNLPKEWFNELKAMTGNANDQGQVLGHATNFSSTGFYQDTVSITFKGFELIFTKMLTTFKAIDFSNNSFDGPIPESIGRLVSLHGLNMSHNNFEGQIPSRFSNLSQLEALDLSWNKLSGEIPQDLTSLTSLEWLNLSYNNLSGRIPRANQFLTFSSSSFDGNVGVCGLPLSKQCDTPASIAPSAVPHPESNSLWQDKLGVILLFTFIGLGFGVGFALSLVLRLRWRIEGWLCKH